MDNDYIYTSIFYYDLLWAAEDKEISHRSYKKAKPNLARQDGNGGSWEGRGSQEKKMKFQAPVEHWTCKRMWNSAPVKY